MGGWHLYDCWNGWGTDQPFAVEVTGPKGVKIELPRTDGATRVVKHTLEGLGQQLDLYLVFKVSLPASKAEAEKK